MTQEITLSTLKLHNERLAELLRDMELFFKWQPVTPKDTIESIMYRSGQASVVDYIKIQMEET